MAELVASVDAVVSDAVERIVHRAVAHLPVRLDGGDVEHGAVPALANVFQTRVARASKATACSC